MKSKKLLHTILTKTTISRLSLEKEKRLNISIKDA
jgi:hypothetical protein